MERGRFLSLEGGEGAGKSTQQQLIAQFLEGHGIPCLLTREPGGSPGAEQIRKLLVTGETDRWDGVTETLLFYAARRDHVRRLIQPALDAGQWVICDRFSDSTRAYQWAGRGVEADVIDQIHGLAIGNFKPDMTLILDLPVTAGLNRAHDRGNSENRYEQMDPTFHERLRRAFLEIAENDRTRCHVIDATPPVEQVFAAIVSVLEQRFGLSR